MVRTLTDGEREVLAEANADARDALTWDEVHAECDIEPCAECMGLEELDALTFAPMVGDAQAEYISSQRPDPAGDDYPF